MAKKANKRQVIAPHESTEVEQPIKPFEVIQEDNVQEISAKDGKPSPNLLEDKQEEHNVLRHSVTFAPHESTEVERKNNTRISISITYPKGYVGKRFMKEGKVYSVSKETANRLEKTYQVTYH